jgi:hypothetical protein
MVISIPDSDPLGKCPSFSVHLGRYRGYIGRRCPAIVDQGSGKERIKRLRAGFR